MATNYERANFWFSVELRCWFAHHLYANAIVGDSFTLHSYSQGILAWLRRLSNIHEINISPNNCDFIQFWNSLTHHIWHNIEKHWIFTVSSSLHLKMLIEIWYEIWRNWKAKSPILPTVKHFETVIWFWWSICTDRLLLYGLYFESMHCLSSPFHLMVKCFKINHVEAKLAEPLRSTSPLASTLNLKFLLDAFVPAVSLLVLWVAVTTAAFLFFYRDSCALAGLIKQQFECMVLLFQENVYIANHILI